MNVEARSVSEMPLPSEGGCRCGQLRFRVTAPLLMTAVCHCRGCQRMTGAPYSTTAIVPAGGFEVIAGETRIGGVRGADLNHFHCPDCLGWAFTRVVGMEEQFVNVRATLFDEASWFVPYLETYTSTKLPWVSVPAVRRYEQFPPMETYAGLVEEYTASVQAKETGHG